LHINYTALYDGGNFAGAAKGALKKKLPEIETLLFSPRQDFPDAWNLMDSSGPQMNFEIKPEHLPFFMRGREGIAVTAIFMLLSVNKRENVEEGVKKDVEEDVKKTLSFTIKGEDLPLTLQPQDNGNILIYEGAISVDNLSALGWWDLKLNLKINTSSDKEDIIALSDIEDIVVGVALITGVDSNNTGGGEGGGTDTETCLLTNSLDKIVTNNNQNITLNN
jgi:hypothetical protein